MIFDSSRDEPGRALKSVEVWTNDPENKMLMLMLTGNVTPAPESEEEKCSEENAKSE